MRIHLPARLRELGEVAAFLRRLPDEASRRVAVRLDTLGAVLSWPTWADRPWVEVRLGGIGYSYRFTARRDGPQILVRWRASARDLPRTLLAAIMGSAVAPIGSRHWRKAPVVRFPKRGSRP